MSWERIYPKNIGGDAADIKRCYGFDGETYPRINISIYIDFVLHNKDTFTIGCNMKESEFHHWEKEGIPNELFDEVLDMLKELKERLCNVQVAKQK